MQQESTIKMDFQQVNIKMEFDEENCRTIKDMSCVHCKTTDGLFSVDTVFMMYCDNCFADKKDRYKMEWFAKMRQVLLPCEVCLESYTKEKHLVFHLCNRVDVDSCEHCGQQFYSRKSMDKHYKIVHRSVFDRGDSMNCSGISTPKFQLNKKKHRKSLPHDSNLVKKRFQCLTCSKSFSYKGNLKSHTRSHTDEKPFQCTVCSKSFTRKDLLIVHTRCHTGEKPFQCPICCMRFTQKGDLGRHTRSHIGEKPFQCSTCNKHFSQKGDLTRHTRFHTGEKPFQCPICSKCFSRNTNLKRHARSHAYEKPFQCSTCTKCFSQKHHLTIHSCQKNFYLPNM